MFHVTRSQPVVVAVKRRAVYHDEARHASNVDFITDVGAPTSPASD
jgi:hypothetical protein